MFGRKRNASPPPIYADLLLEVNGEVIHVDVERAGWLKDVQPLYDVATRIGLVMRRRRKPSVWLTVTDGTPQYFSRVNGKIDPSGHKQVRVACIQCGDVRAWLHRDGLVEVAPEPTYRET
jgi:hypothetical protein